MNFIMSDISFLDGKPSYVGRITENEKLEGQEFYPS